MYHYEHAKNWASESRNKKQKIKELCNPLAAY